MGKITNWLLAKCRAMMQKTLPYFIIEHDNHWYFKVITTTDNVQYNTMYASYIDSYYLDGVQMSSSYFGYNPPWAWIKIPTAGTHKIWLKPRNWDSNSNIFRPFGNNTEGYADSHVRQLQYTNSTLKTLYINRSTPPTWNSGQSAYSKLEKIYVPFDCVQTYKTTWTQLASKIEGANFKTISQ